MGSLDLKSYNSRVARYTTAGRLTTFGVCSTLWSHRGGATILKAAGLLTAVIQQEVRWRSGAFMDYVRAKFEDAKAVSKALSVDTVAEGIQP